MHENIFMTSGPDCCTVRRFSLQFNIKVYGHTFMLFSLNFCKGKYLDFALFAMMDGWMTCSFTSFSTVFQSYQDDGRLIMKGCVQ